MIKKDLNKNNKSLGSTAIDGSVDGIITLKLDQNLKNKILFSYESRDYESIEFVLKRNESLIFEKSETDSNDLNTNLLVFLNYAIRQKEFSFTISEITGKLNLQIVPSVFDKLLKSNLDNLEKDYPNVYEIQERLGEDKKCLEYCSCCKFCPYYQEKYMKGEENE